MALVLVIASALTLKSFLRLRGIDLGYRPENTLTFILLPSEEDYPERDDKRRIVYRVLQRIRDLPGVEAAGAAILRPFEAGVIGWDSPLLVEGQPRDPDSLDLNPTVNWEGVTPDYFRAMGIELLAGRDFDEHDTDESPPVAIVSMSLARRLWPGENPLGKRLWTPFAYRSGSEDDIWHTVIGMVEDATYRDVLDPRFDFYVPYRQASPLANQLVIRTELDPLTLASTVRREIRLIDANLPLTGLTTLEEIINRQFAPWRFTAQLFGFFSVIAVTLAVIGLFGVISYTVAERTRELGIRMALGANRSQVLGLVLRQGMAMTFAGLAAGLVLAFGLTRFLVSFLYGVSPTDPRTYLLITVSLAGVAFLACYLPARRAARVDPLVALRHE